MPLEFQPSNERRHPKQVINEDQEFSIIASDKYKKLKGIFGGDDVDIPEEELGDVSSNEDEEHKNNG